MSCGDAAEDGVRYIEIGTRQFSTFMHGLNMVKAVRTVRGLRRAEKDFGIIGRSSSASYGRHPEECSRIFQLRSSSRTRRGRFDLGGGEGKPVAARAAFKYARENNLGVTVHAGEGTAPTQAPGRPPCGANASDATRLIEDPELTQYVNDRRIALEVCLTSNVQTKVADSYEAHPLREYFDRGLNVTLNTDNRLMSGTTLTDEYVHAAEHLGFTVDELAGIALNGFESAFLPWEERLMLIEEASDKIEELIGFDE